MRAVVCRSWDGPEKLRVEQIEPPSPGPGEVLIDVKAAGLNTTDVLLVSGRHQTNKYLSLPYVPGLEAAGVLVSCGEGVDRFQPGDRVMGLLPYGGLAEQAAAKAGEVFAMPDCMGFDEAGAFPVSYVSSHLALHWNGRLQVGEALLVLGSSSGVGLAAVQIGKAVGAWVIAAASSEEKLAFAKSNGADELVNYGVGTLKDQVLALTNGKGVDVCFDPIGGPLCDQALSCLNWGGRILHLGFVGGFQSIPANRLLVKNRSSIGCSTRHFRLNHPEKLRASFEELLRWIEQGKVKPNVSRRFPLERCADAFDRLTQRQVFGKVVINP